VSGIIFQGSVCANVVTNYFVVLSYEMNVNGLKGHGNEADFLGFLQKLVPHRFLTLPFEPFRLWLRIRRDIRNRKMTPRLAESESRFLNV
jgi:hypothetical protein